jgi:hypothetical protein
MAHPSVATQCPVMLRQKCGGVQNGAARNDARTGQVLQSPARNGWTGADVAKLI